MEQQIAHIAAQRVEHVTGRRHAGDAAETVISRDQFAAAWDEITSWPGYAPTPLHNLTTLAKHIGVADIHYKDEGPRFGLGSFKALGAAYAALTLLEREIAVRTGKPVSREDIKEGRAVEAAAGITLCSATDGNHGRSLSWGCQRFGAPCRIYIHAEVSEARADAMRAFGTDVIRIDGDYDESVRLCRDEADANGWFVVSDTSWEGYTEPPRDVMAGYGVMAGETAKALPAPPTHVFVQGGVGGYAAAVAAYFRQHWGTNAPRVVAVEPDRAACLYASGAAGKLTAVQIEEETIMAGLSCGEPSPLAWDILAEEVLDFLRIPDEMVGPTMRLLANPLEGDPKIEAGESAVGALAALIAARSNPELSAQLGLDASSRVVMFGTEGVTDPEIFARIMAEAD
ncbi:MAG: diaminopropionate ammonia-lyase [Pseudomonadota bacterium]